jgi:hypothetical protein
VVQDGPPDEPYISHPLMAFDMIWRTEGYEAKLQKTHGHLQDREMELLAAALLHDVLEDYKPYRADQSLMRRDLQRAIKAQELGVDFVTLDAAKATLDDSTENSVNHIYQLCEQMMNPNKPLNTNYKYPVDKRMFQADRVVHKIVDPDARILKMADQMASMICHLSRADNPEKFSKEKARKAGNKGNDLIRAVLDMPAQKTPIANMEERSRRLPFIKTQDEKRLEPWRDLYEQVLGYYRRIVAEKTTVADEQCIREEFSKDPLTVKPLSKADWNKQHPLLQRFGDPIILRKSRGGHGVSAISLNKQGDVIGYVNWESPENEGSYRNDLEIALRDSIERERRDVEVYSRGFTSIKFLPREKELSDLKEKKTEDGRPLGDDLYRGRIFRLSAPIPLQQFLDIAGRNLGKNEAGDAIQAISSVERLLIEARVKTMQRVNQHMRGQEIG